MKAVLYYDVKLFKFMNISDNIAALIYLKNKVHKWKNIAILLAAISLLFGSRLIFGNGLLSDVSNVEDYIATIKIDGVIMQDDYRSEVLQKIAEEKSVKAVIIDIDSPGGGIVGSEILFEELRNIAAHKPIVVTMGSVAASGGYMAAIASDHIIARNGTLTGSVGVLMESPDVTDLASKVGVKFHNYKSSPLKGSPSPFEKSSLEVDRVINDSIQDSYKFFADLVRERRGKKLIKETKSVLDGRVFTGRQALKVGLVDEIGGKEQALHYLEKDRKIDIKKLSLKPIEIEKHETKFFDKFLGILPFFNGAKSLNSGHEIMAVMPL
ncbi:MAG: signal peptide peptidase SppA [Proteobacteria bacterium]|nr:signal peptide peptidase SppA [Pseudomonadota bacterium]